ncbi:unnamed protein product, partial [marine sediment metagenome]
NIDNNKSAVYPDNEFGYTNKELPGLYPGINYSLIPTVNSSDFWDDLDTPADLLLSMFDGPNWIDTDLDLRWQDLLQIDEMWANTGYFADIEVTDLQVSDGVDVNGTVNFTGDFWVGGQNFSNISNVYIPYNGAIHYQDKLLKLEQGLRE